MQGSSWRSHRRLFCFTRNILGAVACAQLHIISGADIKEEALFLGFCPLFAAVVRQKFVLNCETEMLERLTHTQTTQTTIGWHPDTQQ